MLLRLLILFTIIPLIELFILIKLGSYIGALNTIIIVLLTGIVGAYLAKMEGIKTLGKIRENLNAGRMPAGELVDGILIFVAGAFLITPGVMTDCLGFFLLIPGTRDFFKAWVRKQFEKFIEGRRYGVTIDRWH